MQFDQPLSLDDETDPPLSRADRRDQTMQHIMKAATRCFVRSGFQGASMQQVCAEAGMSPGALYRYFPSKEAIIEAISEAHRKDDADIFARMFENPDIVDGFVRAAMEHIRHIHEAGTAPLFAEIRAESMRNPAVSTICQATMADVDSAFRNYLDSAIARGDVAPVIETDVLIPMMVAVCEGLVITDIVGMGIPFDRVETMLRLSVESLLRPRVPSIPNHL